MDKDKVSKPFPVDGLIGRKLGMVQWFGKGSESVAVTVIKVGPCTVAAIRRTERDGYNAAQIGLLEPIKVKALTRAQKNHLKKAGAPYVRKLAEFRILGKVEPGQQLTVSDVFQVGERVDVVGWSKGKGFQGAMKRHGFSGQAASHGAKIHRTLGSVGSATFPGRTLKGLKMAGRMGNKRVKVRNLRVVFIDPENHLMGVAGGVPGGPNGYLFVSKAKADLQGILAEQRALLDKEG